MKKNEQNFNLSCVQLNNKDGITLIALIITIIVLLTLAGISISMLTGDNSIIKNAQKAKVETENAAVEEKVRLAVMGAYDSNGKFNVENFTQELDKMRITYTETDEAILIELPNGKQIMVSKETGEITELVSKIVYNYNGGEDIGQVPSDDTEYKEGENATIKFSPITEREGFQFLGWSTNANATEPEYTADGTNTITMEKKGIPLYAVWRGIPYTISYDANTGTGAVPSTETGIKGQNVAVNFTPAPTKIGYTFVGWSEDKTSNSAEYTTDGIKTIKMPAKNVTLYAIWMANSNIEYKVEHYQMDTSGHYPTTPTGSNTYTDGTTGASITVANKQEIYEGFTYRYGTVNDSEEHVTTTTVAGDGSRVIKLYYERNIYTVNYNANNGNVTPTSAKGYYGASITLPTPTRTGGYKFDGWYTQETGGSKVNHITMPVNGATVYARWTYLLNTVGNEVTVGEENFYVIEANPESSTADVKLLSKFNLNQAGDTQIQASSNMTACAFSNRQYWTGNSENLNTANAPSESAYQKVKAYGTAKGGIGRLLTYDEALSVKAIAEDKLIGRNIGAPENFLMFWLGTSHDSFGTDGMVWRVDGGNAVSMINYDTWSANSHIGIRAVLEIAKDKIS